MAMLHHAVDADWIDRPVKVGKGFRKKTRTELRSRKKKLWTPTEIGRIVGAAGPQMKAMILLGLNGAFGSTDCANLSRDRINLTARFIEYPRRKTGEERVVPLWPRTIEALKIVMAMRPDDSLVFRTKHGLPWVRSEGNSNRDSVVVEFNKILRRLDEKAVADAIERGSDPTDVPQIKVNGVGFYSLRHTFATYADAARDPNAKKRIMGHRLPGLDDVYVEGLELDRLRAVADFVEAKCFPVG